MLKLLSVLLMVAVAAPALAQTSGTPTKPQQPAKPKLICEKQEEIGTRLGGRKVCHTKEEWDQLRSAAREDLEKSQRNSSPGIPSGSD
jgi:hypothetical protein